MGRMGIELKILYNFPIACIFPTRSKQKEKMILLTSGIHGSIVKVKDCIVHDIHKIIVLYPKEQNSFCFRVFIKTYKFTKIVNLIEEGYSPLGLLESTVIIPNFYDNKNHNRRKLQQTPERFQNCSSAESLNGRNIYILNFTKAGFRWTFSITSFRCRLQVLPS